MTGTMMVSVMISTIALGWKTPVVCAMARGPSTTAAATTSRQETVTATAIGRVCTTVVCADKAIQLTDAELGTLKDYLPNAIETVKTMRTWKM